MYELADNLIETTRQHLAGGYEWTPWVVTIGVLLAAAVLLLKGARLTTFLISIVFAGVGAGAGALVARQAGLPHLPTTLIASVALLLLGVFLARIWLAALFALFATCGSLGLYYAKVLDPAIWRYRAGEGVDVTLLDAGESPAVFGGWMQRVEWDYLQAHVPHLEMSLLAIAISTGLAGLVFGLMLPAIARAVAAATLGTLTLLAGVYGLLHLLGLHEQAAQLGSWTWGVTGGIWLFSVLYNLLDQRRRDRGTSRKTSAADSSDAPAGAAAKPVAG